MSDPIKYMDLTEFVETGYLHELNRLFLHPLGLALEVVGEDDGTISRISGVWDYRDDPEGVAFASANKAKADRIAALQEARKPGRIAALGYWIQPPADDDDE